jgi:hypothetical protein
MSSDEPARPGYWEKLSTTYLIYLAVTPLILFSILAVVLALMPSTAPTTNSGGGASTQAKESGVETAARSLTRQTDIVAIRTALQQINAELNEDRSLRPPPLTKEQKNWLRAHLGLGDDELAEIENEHYTRLDGHHLDGCFLMRDAANALEVKGVRGKGGAIVVEKPLDRAARAFAWVMRQVRLRERENEETEAPPAFVLRRGWGNALERVLVFLALLEQLGPTNGPRRELLGCLLETPGGADRMRFWVCGVVVGGDKDVYLFDPRLGLPLPGPKGEGVATLAQARRQPEILAQLNIGAKYRYPVTMEQARAARAQLVCPLSALSPRMRHLQDKLLVPTVRVRLADDAANDLERLHAAVAAGADKPTPVLLPSDKATLLRRFMPVNEGGVDASYRKDRLTLDLVPWRALPPVFLDENKFPPKIGLGQRVRQSFAAPFIHTMMDPGFARDMLLRGRYSSAVPALVAERDHWRNQLQQRASAVDLNQKAAEWLDKAIHEYALQVRAKLPQERAQAEQEVKKLWDDRNGWPIYLLINSAAATARDPEVGYQLALCSQEQAEQVQARLDVQAHAGGAAPHRLDVEKARQAWQTALNNWKLLEEDYPGHPDLAAGRRLRGRAEAMLGDRQAALASWKEIKGYQTDLEKIAALFLAQQLEKQSGQDKK